MLLKHKQETEADPDERGERLNKSTGLRFTIQCRMAHDTRTAGDHGLQRYDIKCVSPSISLKEILDQLLLLFTRQTRFAPGRTIMILVKEAMSFQYTVECLDFLKLVGSQLIENWQVFEKENQVLSGRTKQNILYLFIYYIH